MQGGEGTGPLFAGAEGAGDEDEPLIRSLQQSTVSGASGKALLSELQKLKSEPPPQKMVVTLMVVAWRPRPLHMYCTSANNVSMHV